MRHRSILLILVIIGALVAFASAAQAETTGPVWKIIAVSNPTNFKPGVAPGVDNITVLATNVGGASTGCTTTVVQSEHLEEEDELRRLELEYPKAGEIHLREILRKKAFCTGSSPVVSPVTVSDSLPAGLTSAEFVDFSGERLGVTGLDTYRKPAAIYPVAEPSNMQCSSTPTVAPSCTEPERVDPGDTLTITIPVSVSVKEGEQVPDNVVTVSGGGAASASVSDPVTVSSQAPPYGVAPGGVLVATSTSQAGAHPNVTSTFFLNTVNALFGPEKNEEHAGGSGPVGAPKDISFDLPPGLVGTTVGMPRCTMANVLASSNCPRDTMVGTTTIFYTLGGADHEEITVPVFNITPAPGEPAAFAFNAVLFPVRLDTSVLSDGDYGVRVTAHGLTQGAATFASSVTIWGVPAEHSGPGHDFANVNSLAYEENQSGNGETEGWRSFGGPAVEEKEGLVGGLEKIPAQSRVPLLTNPSQCTEPLTGVLETDSWEGAGPGVFAGPGTASTSVGSDTGCGLLSFKPSVSMLPDTLEAGAPAGYSMQLRVPQDVEAKALATPDVKKIVATLPLGTVVSPSVADGLGDCTNAEFFGSGPREAAPAKPGECPRDSQVGAVRVKSPALEEDLTGAVYLATPDCDPCTPQDASDGQMIRLFLQFQSEGEGGIVVKLEGTGQINQQTGQLTFTFDGTPPLPFSESILTLTGGERAALANPRMCGPVSTTVDLTPWSTPYTADAAPTSSFDVDENCFGPQFNPSFSAGTTNNQAGETSEFTLSFGRSDEDEFLNGLQLKLPPGLLGVLSKVSLCGEPQAAEGTCGPESLIGHVSVATGPGADPYVVNGGQVFITGPYKGAPYGLSIVVPAKAGPYTLAGTTGKGTVVERAAISVDPTTSALTVTADPLPTVLDGIPLQLRQVNVTIDRPGFTFNPTDCDKLAITATLTSTEAASVGASSPFQVTNCGSLKFQPKFTVSTSGKTSRVGGANLDARLTYPQNYGEANIAQVKVELPKQLPSRLPTLQKACKAAVFEANPANCPAASVVGVVKASTPILKSSLSGPVYFVSHGGEAFPSLIMVLQAEGVRVDLVGSTFISKAGVTSTTLKTVPDVPVSSFELYLPEGPTSALTTDGVLCRSSPVMPTTFIAQDGTELHQSIKVAVTGCAKAKKKAKAKKASGGRAARTARKSSHGKGGK